MRLSRGPLYGLLRGILGVQTMAHVPQNTKCCRASKTSAQNLKVTSSLTVNGGILHYPRRQYIHPIPEELQHNFSEPLYCNTPSKVLQPPKTNP